MKLYKLTDESGRTRNNTQWGPGVSHSGTGKGGLCGSGWIHAYEHPLLAVLLNSLHANFARPKLWEAEGKIGKRDGQLKCGCQKLTVVREIPLPAVSTEQRIKFAIWCALEVYAAPGFVVWANNWLSGADRTTKSAESAARAAEAAEAVAAAESAAWAAATAESAAWVAEWAAKTAAAAVEWVANNKLDLVKIAKKAIK